MSSTLNVTIEFGGGTELLTATPKVKVHRIELPAKVSHAPAVGPQATVTAPTPNAGDAKLAGSVNGNEQGQQAAEQERPTDLKYVLQWIRANLIVERPEMLLDGDGVRAGILVLINDADWELEGEEEYIIKEGDRLTFISTLHGG